MIYGSQSLRGRGGGERAGLTDTAQEIATLDLKLINYGPHGNLQTPEKLYLLSLLTLLGAIRTEPWDQQRHKQHELKDHTSSQWKKSLLCPSKRAAKWKKSSHFYSLRLQGAFCSCCLFLFFFFSVYLKIIFLFF